MKKTLGIFLLLAAIFLITGIIEPRFLRVGNLTNMARWTGLYGILAIGAGFVIITSGIDLSIGSLIGLTGSLFPLFLVGVGLPVGVGFALGHPAGVGNRLRARGVNHQAQATALHRHALRTVHLPRRRPAHHGRDKPRLWQRFPRVAPHREVSGV